MNFANMICFSYLLYWQEHRLLVRSEASCKDSTCISAQSKDTQDGAKDTDHKRQSVLLFTALLNFAIAKVCHHPYIF
jgi:hypothetical protein